MLAEYEVNSARVARNVVSTTKRPDVVGMSQWVPCWHIAPHTNEPMSLDDGFDTSNGFRNWTIITTNTMINRIKMHFHTWTSSGKTKMFETADSGGWRNTIGVLVRQKIDEFLHSVLFNRWKWTYRGVKISPANSTTAKRSGLIFTPCDIAWTSLCSNRPIAPLNEPLPIGQP